MPFMSFMASPNHCTTQRIAKFPPNNGIFGASFFAHLGPLLKLFFGGPATVHTLRTVHRSVMVTMHVI